MKDKKFKNLEDLFEGYSQLLEDETEANSSLEKARKKLAVYLSSEPNPVYKLSEGDDIYKAFLNIQKSENKLQDLKSEKVEFENLLKEFFGTLNGGKISFDKKEDDKVKSTFLFWLEEDQVKSEKQ
jgi:hypothetical protein